MYPIRNSVKALIIRDNRLLCIQKSDVYGSYYLLPGGGQEKHETFNALDFPDTRVLIFRKTGRPRVWTACTGNQFRELVAFFDNLHLD